MINQYQCALSILVIWYFQLSCSVDHKFEFCNSTTCHLPAQNLKFLGVDRCNRMLPKCRVLRKFFYSAVLFLSTIFNPHQHVNHLQPSPSFTFSPVCIEITRSSLSTLIHFSILYSLSKKLHYRCATHHMNQATNMPSKQNLANEM